MLMIFYFQKSTFCLQICYDCLSCLIAVHACIFRVILYDLSIVCQYIDHFQIMTKSYLKVVRVMCRCDLYNTCTKLHIYIIICDDRDLTVYDRQIQHLAYHIFITIILRIDCYGCITEKCLRTCGCQINISGTVCGLITQMPKMTCLILIFYLCIRNRSQTMRTPVDNTLSTIDQSLVVQIDKYFLDCLGASLIHGETLSVPVAGRTDLFQLFYNAATVLLLPVPNMLQKLLSADIILGNTLLPKFFHYLCLCGNGCMVGSRYPECLITLHSLKTDQNILKCIIQGMSHVELSRDIWRWHNDRKRFLVAIYLRMKVFFLLPFIIGSLLNVRRIVVFFQFFCHCLTSFLLLSIIIFFISA